MLTSQAQTFVRNQVAAILREPRPASDPAPGLAEQWFREWARMPEYELAARDAWGNWDFSFGESNRLGLLYQPWLDQQVLDLRGDASLPETTRGPAWPGGHRFAVCLTHDLDYVTLEPTPRESLRHLSRDAALLWARGMSDDARNMARHSCLRAVFRLATAKGLHRRRERGYDEWLGLEARHGFHSTFFVFPEHVSSPHPYDCTYAYDDPTVYANRRMTAAEMIREIDRAGWEIGLHGSYRSAVQAGLLAGQKRQVEHVIGRPVISTRQHWLHYDVRVTPRLQAEAGLLVDSTQGFNRNVGFRAGTSFPYPCWDHAVGEKLPVLEVPQHVMDGALFTGNALGLTSELAVRHCIQMMDSVEAVGGCLTLSWHPNSLQYPEYWDTYEQVLAEAARRGAWGCSVRELHGWWAERAARSLGEPERRS